MTAFIELVGRDVKSSLAVGRVNLGERIETLLQKELEQVNPDIAAKVREKVLAALSSTFKTMEFQTASVARLPEPEIAAASEMSGKAVVAAGVPSLIKWMDKNVIKYEFFSVKFLREKVFAADPVAQEALQFCIDQGIVETYQRANPKNPTRPTTACQLNRKHRVVRSVLGDDPAVDKKDGEN